MIYSKINKKLIDWYDHYHKEMPWRGENDPYKIWISEIMLQQTQIATVIPYYNRWLKLFPTIKHVATATQDDILKAWEGLGYYSRAINFHQTCKELANNKFKVPSDIEIFLRLKGVGPYIASAVFSIAYDMPIATVDGNVNRVISRINAYKIEPTKHKNQINKDANQLMNKKRPGDFNQAIMDLGRYVCKPKNPICTECPISDYCKAYKLALTDSIPIKKTKKIKPHYNVAVGIIWKNQKLLITKRKEGGLLGGLWEFPGGKIKKKENVNSAIIREIKEELSIDITPRKVIKKVDHHYSHFSVTINAIDCNYSKGAIKLNGPTSFKWISKNKLDDFAFPKASLKLFNVIRDNV